MAVDRTEGLRRFSRWMASISFLIAQKIFKFSERQRYWKKFKPLKTPTFLVFSRNTIGIREIRSIMRAFNVNGKAT